MARVLFVLKKKEVSNLGETVDYSDAILSNGLSNSAVLISNMLNTCGIESKVCFVIDNNDIDREVSRYNPTHVIIEALWVVPSKFRILTRLHPRVKWVVHIHSHTPFLSNEGIAIDWLSDYIKQPNVFIGVNDKRMEDQLESIGTSTGLTKKYVKTKIIYLPNYYDLSNMQPPKYREPRSTINVGCFGAIRPMKNHLIQAIAAISLADEKQKTLKFHVNVNCLEQGGNSVYNNLKKLFQHSKRHSLVEHSWTPHVQFLQSLRQIDIGMQVSFSETFNIVSADMILQGIPIVVSSEIPWACRFWVADPNDQKDITKKLKRAYKHPLLNVLIHRFLLRINIKQAKRTWISFLRGRELMS